AARGGGRRAAVPTTRGARVAPVGRASCRRSRALPDVPHSAGSGAPFDGGSWRAIVAPPGVPADVSAKLNAEIAATLQQPAVKERLARIGLEVVASSPAELTAALQRDVPKWGKAVKDSGAVAE
ncbi:MAG: tripartite tricarboxylate transporter substrate binding protein, partial [Reyranella sp.]|nr:tripartite tricarboxylate transporter substrate binding protein [Reyranella sp.]